MIQTTTPTPLILRPKSTCTLIGVAPATLERYCASGELTKVKLGPRAVGITRASIVAFAERRAIPLPPGF